MKYSFFRRNLFAALSLLCTLVVILPCPLSASGLSPANPVLLAGHHSGIASLFKIRKNRRSNTSGCLDTSKTLAMHIVTDSTDWAATWPVNRQTAFQLSKNVGSNPPLTRVKLRSQYILDSTLTSITLNFQGTLFNSPVVFTNSSGAYSGSATLKTQAIHTFFGTGGTAGIPDFIQPSWSDLAGTPTTVAGYNITDALIVNGKAGGQTINGGTGSAENLTLTSTLNATKGKIIFGSSSAFDEQNIRLGIGTLTPSGSLDISRSFAGDNLLFLTNLNSNSRSIIQSRAGGTIYSGGAIDWRAYGENYSETLFGNLLTGGSLLIAQPNSHPGPFVMGNYSNSYLAMGTNNAERMRIAANGNVSIGTTTTSFPFTVYSPAATNQTVAAYYANSGATGASSGIQVEYRNSHPTNNKTQFVFGGGTPGTGYARTFSFGTDPSGIGEMKFFLYNGTSMKINWLVDPNGNMAVNTNYANANATLEVLKNGTYDYFKLSSGAGTNGDVVTVSNAGYLGIGVKAPSAVLHLGTSTVAPLKFTLTNATLLTNPQPGAVEPDANGNLFYTNSSGARYQFANLTETQVLTNKTLGTGSTWNGNVITPSYLATGTADATTFLRGDGTWQTINTGTSSIIGTANQVIVTNNAGTTTLSLPQDINTTSIPTFSGMLIGTNTGTLDVDTRLAVNGTIHARQVNVNLNFPGPDYVFEPNYRLVPLTAISTYVNLHHHLPEIPSASEMQSKGIDLGEMNVKLLKKVEELTLYLIDKDNQLNRQQEQINRLIQQQQQSAKLYTALLDQLKPRKPHKHHKSKVTQ